jgi:hypothetical protein
MEVTEYTNDIDFPKQKYECFVSHFVSGGKYSGDFLVVAGIDYSAPLRIISETKQAVMVYKKGHMSWYGRGQQKYYNPSFMVFKYIKYRESVRGMNGEIEVEYKKGERTQAREIAQETFDRIKGEKS